MQEAIWDYSVLESFPHTPKTAQWFGLSLCVPDQCASNLRCVPSACTELSGTKENVPLGTHRGGQDRGRGKAS